MAPNRKKKKPAANPARGFATTSQPSKAANANALQEVLPASTPTTTEGANTPRDSEQDGPKAETNQQPSDSVKDMSPEELEQHLEDAELQDLLDRNGSRCKAESNRHVTRLQNERRQSRVLSHAIYTPDWLSEAMSNWSLESYGVTESSGTSTPVHQSDEDKFVLDLWILQRVLAALKFPDIDKALAHVIWLSMRQQVKGTVTSAYGLTEALDWYAFHYAQKDLPSYEDQSGQQVPSAVLRGHLPEDDTRSNPSTRETSPERRSHTNSAVAQVSEDEFGDTSDSDDDIDDPSRLTEKWIKLQTLIWQRTNQTVPRASKAKSPKLMQLQKRAAEIERDILFDKDLAQVQWASVKIQLQRKQALDRAAMNGSQNLSSGTSTPAEAKELPAPSTLPATSGDAAIDDLDDLDALGSMFETAEAEGTTADDDSTSIRVQEFGRYTGLAPQSLLKQICQTIDPKVTIKVIALHQTSYSARHRLDCWWHTPQAVDIHAVEALPEGVASIIEATHWRLDMVNIATSSATSSADYISTLALALVLTLPGQDFKPAKRLPSVWSNLLTDLNNEQKRLSEAEEKATIRKLRELVAKSKDDPPTISTTPHSLQNGLTIRPRTHHQHKPSPRLDPSAAQQTWLNRSTRPAYQNMLKFRAQLPIYRHKDLILDTIAANAVTIICAETGSGKSTQAGTYILEQQLSAGHDCHILVTQPRRISAISLARRISQEIGEGRNDLGTVRSLVGYAIRLESKTSESTRLTFATTGVLLRMLESSPTLEQLDYLILDEVHERTMEMDLAFIALRKLQETRPSLKIILMSATVNATQFSRYFGNAPVLDIEGRTFPVEVKYLEDALEATNDIAAAGSKTPATIDEDGPDTSDREDDRTSTQATLKGYHPQTLRRLTTLDEYKIPYDLLVHLATAIATKPTFHKYSKAILIFMPGIAEIRRLHNLLLTTPTFAHNWDIHMLHSSFSTEELERAFTIPHPPRRKIVIATNIAETGITIPDVTAVIDTCKEKIMRFDERRQLSRLTEGFTARSSAKQRRGRAARVQEGLCFHLVTKHRHDNLFLEQQVPEMLRLSLQDSIMRIKVWDKEASIEQTLAAAIDPPSRKNVNRAIERLKEAGALDGGERLTALGERVARLPLDVALAKLAILGAVFGCLEQVLTIIALMTSKSIFATSGPGKGVFLRAGSDLLSALGAYQAWRKAMAAGQGAEFARKHHLINLGEIEDNRVQLLVYLVDGGLVVLDTEEKRLLNNARVSSTRRGFYPMPSRYNASVTDDLLLSLIATAFYPRCLIREGKGYRNIFSNQQVSTAKGSVIREMPKPPKWLSFSEAMRTKAGNAINIQEASRIPDMALSLFLGADVDVSLFSGVISVDGRIRLKGTEWKQLLAIKLLRKQLRSLLERRYRSPDQSSARDDQLIELLRTAGH